MRLPELVTFTGVDDWTDVDRLVDLSNRYPGRVEWGMLFSSQRQGRENRYPSWLGIRALLDLCQRLKPPRFSAHLCGEWSRRVMAGTFSKHDLPELKHFSRAQINHHSPEPHMIARFSNQFGMPCIGQSRSVDFPPPYPDSNGNSTWSQQSRIHWLYDRSGGRGVLPDTWPLHPGGDQFVGYSGGLNPGNVKQIVEWINSDGPYWIDMESGVRNEQDRFDLNRCKDVLHAIYGAAA